MKAHVICCNDGIKKVVIGDLKSAETICEEERIKSHQSKPDLAEVLYWHVHTVPLIYADVF